jgi:hypothetical protein
MVLVDVSGGSGCASFLVSSESSFVGDGGGEKKLRQKIDGVTMMVLFVHSEQHFQIFTV